MPVAASSTMSAKRSRPSGESPSFQASRTEPEGSRPQASGPYMDRTAAKRMANESATGQVSQVGSGGAQIVGGDCEHRRTIGG